MKIVLVVLALPAGCDTRETYEDVSTEPQYRDVIGTRNEVVGKVDAFGIRPHSKAPVEYVTLIPPPGIGGTMIAWREPVRPGATVMIGQVVRTNRLFANQMNLGVVLDGTPLPVSVPVKIELTRGNEANGSLQLNPKIYRKLPLE